MTVGAGLGTVCPCGSGLTFVGCCGPVVAGERLASTATELMRSRYTAFAVADVDHLVRSWHPRTRPGQIELDDTTWIALEIIDTVDGGQGELTGAVEFRAHWSRRGAKGIRHERSRFERRAGRWLYLDGDLTR